MQFSLKNIPKSIWVIILSITLLKVVSAAVLPLSNDEVYYHTYALYPSLSHFDHPPMVGWIIQLFTFNMEWKNDFFMRLGAIIFSIINSLIVYQFIDRISSKKTALIAVILYNASFYNSIVSGFFIMPDTGLMTFWLLSISIFHRCLTVDKITLIEKKWILAAGAMVGLAMLAKYQAVFLWLSAFLFIVKYNKSWLIEKTLYLSGLITLLVFSPVIIWNFQNEFISFTFQGERANFFQQGFNYLYFGREFFGQILYTNVVVYILILWSLFYYKKNAPERSISKTFFIYFSLPIILVFLFISIFKSTLPHWSGPGFSTLVLFTSIIIANRKKQKNRFFKKSIIASASLYLFAVIIILLQLSFNIIPIGYHNDPTSDITGWDKLGQKFKYVHQKNIRYKKISNNPVFLSDKWFPAAHYDFYLAEPNNIPLIVTGDLSQGHKYLWINHKRGGVGKGYDAYYISTDTTVHSAKEMYGNYFQSISKPEFLTITRGTKPFVTYYLYILYSYKGKGLYKEIATN